MIRRERDESEETDDDGGDAGEDLNAGLQPHATPGRTEFETYSAESSASGAEKSIATERP